MIIPVRCMTCGKPVGQFWEEFMARRKKGEDPKKILDGMGLVRYCCRSLFLTHVNLTDKVGKFQK
ncbi:MAG: DNA-directed RNA polymerase subunit N [Candidatus Aenigmatarchaeota archaeon]|nr:MAG: DNA-directed RNA polymerase subunit N [Candidatus Aenigmarchaeota archaeon]